MTIKAFAKKFEMTEDEMFEALVDEGFLKKNGAPKTKYLDELFDEDGNILNAKSLKAELDERWTEEDDEDEEEEEVFEEDEDEEIDDEDEELSVDTIKELVENFDGTKEDYAELIGILTDKLVNYSESIENEEDEDEFDDEEEDEEIEDPNEPGKYRGWTISKKGIKVTAVKGKKTLTTSTRGNIREKIDELED